MARMWTRLIVVLSHMDGSSQPGLRSAEIWGRGESDQKRVQWTRRENRGEKGWIGKHPVSGFRGLEDRVEESSFASHGKVRIDG